MQFTTLGSARGAARKGRFPTATIGSSPATSTDASGLLPHDMVTFLNNLQLYGNRSHEELRGIRRILELEEQILKCAEVENYDRARELWEEQLQLLKDLDLWDVAQEFADPDRRTIAEELAADRGAYSYQHPRLGWIDVDDQGVASRRHDPLQDWADTVLPEFDRILLGSIAMLPLAAAGPAGRGAGVIARPAASSIGTSLLTRGPHLVGTSQFALGVAQGYTGTSTGPATPPQRLGQTVGTAIRYGERVAGQRTFIPVAAQSRGRV